MDVYGPCRKCGAESSKYVSMESNFMEEHYAIFCSALCLIRFVFKYVDTDTVEQFLLENLSRM